MSIFTRIIRRSMMDTFRQYSSHKRQYGNSLAITLYRCVSRRIDWKGDKKTCTVSHTWNYIFKQVCRSSNCNLAKGTEEMGWVEWASPNQGHESEQTPGHLKGRAAWRPAVRGVSKSRHNLVSEQQAQQKPQLKASDGMIGPLQFTAICKVEKATKPINNWGKSWVQMGVKRSIIEN